MVIFSECPQCKGKQTVKLHKDISLVEPKIKFKREITCTAQGCGAIYSIAIRIKTKLLIPVTTEPLQLEAGGLNNG
jgi:hypothetical protein